MIFTIGHSTHSLEKFVELISKAGVTAVADVRSVPFSKFQPQFNRSTLPDALKESGIAYVFLGDELGARSDDPSCYADGRVQYSRLAATDGFQRGIGRLQAGSDRYTVSLMCAEKEPLDCHRTLLVARELDRRGIAVSHIHPNSRQEAHADAMLRLLGIAGLSHTDMFRTREELIDMACEFQEKRTAYVKKDSK